MTTGTLTAPDQAADRRDRPVLASEAVDDLVAALAARGYTVLGPTVRDGAIVIDEVRGRADLPVGLGRPPGGRDLPLGGLDHRVGPGEVQGLATAAHRTT